MKRYLRNPFLQSIVIYTLLAIYLLPYYQFQINPDGISYICIAQKYMNCDFANAINGYWGPLISWLLIPFLVFGIKPLLAVKILLLLTGVLTIYQTYVLIKKMEIDKLFRYFLMYLISILVLNFALYAITPDLIVVCLGLLLINIMLDSSYINNKYAGLVSGLIGSGLYLTKGYGFYFFIAVYTVLSAILYFRTRSNEITSKTHVIYNFITGFVVFFIVSSFWIFLLSSKYGNLTINNAANINHAIYGPQSTGIPELINIGLLDPPNSTAISIWEDPTYIKIQSWNIFESFNTIKYQIGKTINNLRYLYSILGTFSILSISLLFASIIYLLQIGKRCIHDNIFFLITLIIIMFTSYALVLVEIRYIWIIDIIIIIIGAKLINLFFETVFLRKVLRVLIILGYSLTFLVFPYHNLHTNINANKTIYDIDNKLEKLNIKGRIASSGDWFSTLYLSFYNNWTYYGETIKSETPELRKELENKNIDYFFVWKPFDEKIKTLEGYEELTKGNIDELRIYKLSKSSGENAH
jgi:hypothetical protein